jgi:hypothetical protein
MDAAFWESFDPTAAQYGTEEPFGGPFGGPMGGGRPWQEPAWGQEPRQGKPNKNGKRTGNGVDAKGSGGEEPASKLSTVEQEALANMHRDGKSFEFIANALGKSATDVVEEFNRQSTHGVFESRPRGAVRGPRNFTSDEADAFFASQDFDPRIFPGGNRIFVDGVPVDVEYVDLDDDGLQYADDDEPTPFHGRPIHSRGQHGEQQQHGRHHQRYDAPRRGNRGRGGGGRGGRADYRGNNDSRGGRGGRGGRGRGGGPHRGGSGGARWDV